MEDDMPRVKNPSGIRLKAEICILGERVTHECAWLGLGLKFVFLIGLS